jgi:beta-N-acetylhexosaminidase
MNATILGPEGLEISDWERGFFREIQPFAFIIFARNIDTPDQVRKLTAQLRETVDHDAPILIDQEGGRVQRMRAPHWREYLPALDQLAQARDPMRAWWLRNRLIAAELLAVGVDANCAPLADIAEDATHPFLYNRLYGRDAASVIQAARICADAHMAGGVLPVLKHIPGHGRATTDSHLAMPRVDVRHADLTAHDFAPFKALNDIAMGMTAHIIFSDIDPDQSATTSVKMMDVIRKEIGFDGLLMTDDISMEALSGSLKDRSTASIAAGCDVILHCNGEPSEMQEVASAAGTMKDAALIRANRVLEARKPPENIDIPQLEAELAALLS